MIDLLQSEEFVELDCSLRVRVTVSPFDPPMVNGEVVCVLDALGSFTRSLDSSSAVSTS